MEKRFKKKIYIALLVLLIVTIVLGIVTIVIGRKPTLEVIQGRGTYNKKAQTFKPNFDDLDVQKLYEKKQDKGDKVGLYYSDIFKNRAISTFRYDLKGEDGKNFIPLDSSVTQITIRRKVRKSLNKKKTDINIKIDWSNLLFLRNQNNEELCAVRKDRNLQEAGFSLLESACKYRLDKSNNIENRDKPLANYDVVAAESGQEYTPLFVNPNSNRFGITKKWGGVDINTKINNAKYLKVFHRDISIRKTPIFIFEVSAGEKTLLAIKEVDIGSIYKIPEEFRGKYKVWYKSNNLEDLVSNETCYPLSERDNISTSQPKYIYGVVDGNQTLVQLNIKYELETADNEYKDLRGLSIKYYLKESEAIDLTKFNLYSEDQHRSLQIFDNDEFDKGKHGYISRAQISYTSTKQFNEKSISGMSLNSDGSSEYTIRYRYNRNKYRLIFKDQNGNQIAESVVKNELGVSKDEYNFNDIVTINPITMLGKTIYRWNVSFNYNGTQVVKETERNQIYKLSGSHVGTEKEIIFTAIADEVNQKKIILKYYKEKADSDEYEYIQDGTKVLDNSNGYTFEKDEAINYLQKMIDDNKPMDVRNKEYQLYPKVFNARKSDAEIDVQGQTFNEDDYMMYKVKYNKVRNLFKFLESNYGEEAELASEEFKKHLVTEEKVKYGNTVSEATQIRNKAGFYYELKDDNKKAIGNLTLKGWKPVENKFNKYCDKDEYFNFTKYRNEDLRGEEKLIELYPVWDRLVYMYVTTYLGDNTNGKKDVDDNGKSKKYNLKYDFICAIKTEFGQRYNFAELKDAIAEEIKDKLAKNHESTLLKSYKEVFNFKLISKDIYGESNTIISKTDVNKFEAYIERFRSAVSYDIDFNYNEDGVPDNIAKLYKEQANIQEHFEKRGLGQLGYNIPSKTDTLSYEEISDEGKHLLKLKEEIIKLKYPKELLKDNPSYEIYKIVIDDKRGNITEVPFTKLTHEQIGLSRDSNVRIYYRPKQYKIEYAMSGSAFTNKDIAPSRGWYLHKVRIPVPINTSKFIRFWKWRYKDPVTNQMVNISSSLIEYIKDKNGKTIAADLIMPAANITLIPVFGDKNYTRVNVIIRTENEDGTYTTHYPDNGVLKGPYKYTPPSGVEGDYFLRGEQDNNKKPDLTAYTRSGYLSNVDYENLYLDDIEGKVSNVGRIDKVGDDYLLSINEDYQGFYAEVAVTFRRYKIKARFYIQKTFGDDYDIHSAEYIFKLKKKEGETFAVKDIEDEIVSMVHSIPGLDTNNIVYKCNDKELTKDEPITVTNSGVTVQVYFKRDLRTITFITDTDLNLYNTRGVVKKDLHNKVLTYRYEYEFADNENIDCKDDADGRKFKGWIDSNGKEFKFKGLKLTENIILRAVMKKEYTEVIVNFPSINGENLRYEDGEISGVGRNNSFRFLISNQHLPYTIKPIKVDGKFYAIGTQKEARFVKYDKDPVITELGIKYEINAIFEQLSDKELDEKYKGTYPQTQKIVSGAVNKNKYYTNLKYGTVETTIIWHKGEKYEQLKLRDGTVSDFLFEPVELEEFPARGDSEQKWSINTIEATFFDNGNVDSNIYGSSYAKEYLEKLVKPKMGVTSVDLPKFGGREEIYKSELPGAFAHDGEHDSLKHIKTTDYANFIFDNFEDIRGINGTEIGFNVFRMTQYREYLKTASRDPSISSYYTYYITSKGRIIPRDNTEVIMGVRPVVVM